MATYSQQSLGAPLSTMATTDDTQDEAIRSYERGATEPTIKPAGLLWDATGGGVLAAALPGGSSITEAMLRWTGSGWTLFCDPAHACINRGGTVAFTANQPMGGFKLTGLAAGSANGDSVRYEQVVRVDSGGELVQNLDAGGFKIVDLGTPTSAADAATKAYVDDSVPTSAAAMVKKSNRDATNPITLKTDGGTEKTVIGARPKRITLRVTGDPRRQDDNTAVAAADLVGVEQVFTYWEADAGGEAGTATVTKAMGDLDATVEFLADGFRLDFRFGGSIWVKLAKIGDSATAGSIQAIVEYSISDEV